MAASMQIDFRFRTHATDAWVNQLISSLFRVESTLKVSCFIGSEIGRRC